MANKRISDFPTLLDANDDDLLLVSSKNDTYMNMKVGVLKEAAKKDAKDAIERAEKNSESNAQAAASSALAATNAEQQANGYAETAKDFANIAAAAAGAATVSIGWDADGYFSTFEIEQEE